MENSFPAAVMASLGRQLRALATAPPPGVSWVPGEGLTEVTCDIDGPPGTPYEGGAFRVKLTLGRDYPAAPPKGHFLTKIFHPNVSPVRPLPRERANAPCRRARANAECAAPTALTAPRPPHCAQAGEICVNTLKRDWAPDTSLSHVLAVIRCLLIVPFPESSLNDEAVRARAPRRGAAAAAQPARACSPATPPPRMPSPPRRASFSWSRTTTTSARRAW